MAATNTGPTIVSMSGSPVLFLPVPTPWPYTTKCENYLHIDPDTGTMIGWHPDYTSYDFGARRCYPPQQTHWVSQGLTASPSVALGPTFVCPERYSAVHSTVLARDSAVETQFTYCCPPDYGLNTIMPPDTQHFVQCASTPQVGHTVPYVTLELVDALVTITQNGGGVQPTFLIRTSTVVEPQRIPQSSLTVYAAPFNGYNIVTRQAVSTGDATTPPVIAGAVVGGVVGLGLLALGAYFIRKRYRHSSAAAAAAVDQPDPAAWEAGLDGDGYGSLPQYGPPYGQATIFEMSGVNQPQELPSGRYAHELPGGK